MNQGVPCDLFHFLRTPTNRSASTGAACRLFLPAKPRQMAIYATGRRLLVQLIAHLFNLVVRLLDALKLALDDCA